jgi:tRNA:m4X modification enzyme
MQTIVHQHTPDSKEKLGGKRKQLDSSPRKRFVVIAKHLCGAGTDLALKSLRDVASQVEACVMATCCHGVCSWGDYVGRDYLHEAFREHGLVFGEAEFELLRRWSTGTVATECKTSHVLTSSVETVDEHATALDGSSNESISLSSIIQHTGLSCDVHGVGRACQRILDYGRCKYVENELEFGARFPLNATSSVELCHYVSDAVTPQNAALVCFKTWAP